MSARPIADIVATLATAMVVASCAVGPDFVTPDPPEADRYTKGGMATRTESADVTGGQAQRFRRNLDVPGEWWRLFRSPPLNALIERSIKANPTLDAAVAALRAAGENVHAQEGKWFPLVQGNFTASRQKTSAALAPVPSSNASVFSLYTAQVIVSYTFDVWGLNYRMVESLEAQAEFQRFQLEAAYLTLTSNVVTAAIQEASLRAQIAATHSLIEIVTKELDILRRQLELGQANRIDVAQQEALLAQARAALPPLEKALAQQRDLLAALSGRFPSEEPPEKFQLSMLHLPRDLPVTVPSILVDQRPDVRASEEQMHSASAQVGVAVANMLPQFTITPSTSAGFISTQLASLFNPQNFFSNLTGSVTHTIFDGLTLLHLKRAAEDNFDQASANYRTTVIAALQNVADVLHALESDAKALKAAVEWEHAAKVSLDLTRQQMQTGFANFLSLLIAEQAYQQAVINLVQARAARLADTVALFAALGGGWWNRDDVARSLPMTPCEIEAISKSKSGLKRPLCENGGRP